MADDGDAAGTRKVTEEGFDDKRRNERALLERLRSRKVAAWPQGGRKRGFHRLHR